ncbi:hypothetical protein NBRC116188_11660 [Oceaniserpentilla sp. 4NH20-0058]
MQGAIGLFSYCVFTAKDSFRGASLGKWITGVQVINLNDQKPASALSCFIRNLSQIVWPIEAVFMTLNSNKRRIGDYLANTQVVISKSMPVYIRAISFIIVLFLYQLSPDLPEFKPSSFDFDQFSEYVIKQSQAYDVAEQALYEQSEIQKIIGPILTIKVTNNSQIHINNEAGEANFWFKVLGEKAEIPVFISLQRQQSQWEIKSIKYEQVITTQ